MRRLGFLTVFSPINAGDNQVERDSLRQVQYQHNHKRAAVHQRYVVQTNIAGAYDNLDDLKAKSQYVAAADSGGETHRIRDPVLSVV